MCGIAGVLLPQATLPRSEIEARLWAMTESVRHRGPDDQEIWTDGLAGLIQARLAIIDLSDAANQPISSQDGSVWLTFNGEIYNFADIRKELEALGYVFRSRGDAEVIANGWHAWGPRVLDRMRGMFALALWDRRTRKLVLARDRVGKKPLYYAPTKSGLLFGSEIKAILTWPGVPRTPNLTAIDRYLSLQYVPGPETAFAGIYRVPPAHYLVVSPDLEGNWRDIEPVRYWRLPEPRAAATRVNAAELQRELVEKLEESVRLRMIADVPLGAFLSGGIDSSSVVAMMARNASGPVKTFSIGFTSKQYDETRYARMVAERYATEHEELIVEPDAVAILPKLVWHYGEPFADPSAVPTYYVSEMARRKVTVALNGDGGDEAFFGYRRYQAMGYLTQLDRMPGWGREGLAALLSLAPHRLQRRLRLRQIRDVLLEDPRRPSQRYGRTIAFFSDRDKASGYGEAMGERGEGSALDLLEPYFTEAGGLVAGANWADFHTYLPDDLLVKVDVASMAHGLEARSPLLDHELFEWAARIPTDIRMHGGLKGLFKAAMAPHLPAAILKRRKMGFGIPIDQWFRGELKELAYEVLLSRSARERGLLRPDYVQSLLDQHCSGSHNHHTRLWALLMLELWFRMWIDGSPEIAVLRPAA
ncbi:MAG TPA: asparagine synthase (glutamine-hydrolyzing) [Stellaceae bacterium]|nr:asparagine synthase (glutamine-hydrolyzing) [Stellaceae bacterium]